MKRKIGIFSASIYVGFLGLMLIGCNKDQINGITSEFVDVEEKNSALYFLYSSTNSAACGGAAFDSFALDLGRYDSLHVMATITLGDIGGANNDTVFTSHFDQFNVFGVPFFQRNLDSLDMDAAIAEHESKIVVANSNYELEFETDKILIHTTTKFFQGAPTEKYYLTPYVIVDSLVAYQEGHPDLGAATHRKAVVDIGRLPGYDPQYFGYKISDGNTDSGYRFNLTFEVDRLPSWTNEDHVSVALLITKRDADDNPIFVNANTQH